MDANDFLHIIHFYIYGIQMLDYEQILPNSFLVAIKDLLYVRHQDVNCHSPTIINLWVGEKDSSQ
jgi:hypothetical protein